MLFYTMINYLNYEEYVDMHYTTLCDTVAHWTRDVHPAQTGSRLDRPTTQARTQEAASRYENKSSTSRLDFINANLHNDHYTGFCLFWL